MGGNLEKHKIIQAKSGHCVHFVDFDVTLTVTQETETKAGIGIFASVIGIGAQDKQTMKMPLSIAYNLEYQLRYLKFKGEYDVGF